MSNPSRGKSPVVVAPLPTRNSTILPDGAKSAFLGVLGRAVGNDAVCKKLEEATLTLVGNTLEIQTNVSAAALRLLFTGDVLALMEGVLAERGAGNVKVKPLPAVAEKAGSGPAPSAAVSASLKKLSLSAEKLNKVSDQLKIQVEMIDREFKRLNLGVTAWVTITEDEDEDGNWSQDQLGYTRIGSRWGVALRSRTGMLGDPDGPDESFWGFADAPRQLRIRAVQHIPKLIEKLSEEAEAMISRLSPEVDEITRLTDALLATSEVKK